MAKPHADRADSSSQWFAVRSATRRETAAHDGLVEQGFTVFLPCETRWSQNRWNKVKIDRPLFRGYMFVLCAPEDFHQILDIEGVHQFVRYMANEIMVPMPIPTAAVIEIQANERRGAFDATRVYTPPYRPKKGDRVRVTSGPWQAFIGKLLSTPTKDRAHVMIEGPHGRGVTLNVAHLSAA
jgi:transcription antitermination factor NusG